MIDIQKLRAISEPKLLVLGNHEGIVQSILDFDVLANKQKPSVVGIVGTPRRWLRYFWGDKEILVPGFVSLDTLHDEGRQAQLFITAQSGRRAVVASEEALKRLPSIHGGMIFAEGVPERHALSLHKTTKQLKKFILGPASVGLTIGGSFKLGPIGGTLPEQIVDSSIILPGNTAIISTSGGMVNELINFVTTSGGGISFAAAVGGERYPLTSPVDLVAQAFADPQTKNVVYFGELGGIDEYDVARFLQKTKQPKQFIAYIAGSIAQYFDQTPQFGHAKALAQNKTETALAKRELLRRAGAYVATSFVDFEDKISSLPKIKNNAARMTKARQQVSRMRSRRSALFVNSVSSDKGGEVKILGSSLADFVSKRSLSDVALCMFLGTSSVSRRLADFFDTSVKLLVDHGPQVSGAVNTMITARAGKDLSAALASGILTIGPRFGGALGQAAEGWFRSVNVGETPTDYVERFAKSKQYIAGIGHKKYSANNPDPRVELLLSKYDKGGKYTNFAKKVANITTQKKAQLILNVDGAIAALLLDILDKDERYSSSQIKDLLSTDFCNAIFIYARSVGFTAHFLEQQRLDEGLFRMPDD